MSYAHNPNSSCASQPTQYGRTALDVAKTKNSRDVYVILEAATKAYQKTVPPKKAPELIEVEAYLKKLGLEAALPQFVRGGLNSLLVRAQTYIYLSIYLST